METRLFSHFGHSLSEHRLCHVVGENPENKIKTDADRAKIEKEGVGKDAEVKREKLKKETALRAEVKKFENELRSGNALKLKLEAEAKEKKTEVDPKALAEQNAKEKALLESVTNMMRDLASQDPQLIIQLENESRVLNFSGQIQTLFNAPESRKTLLDALGRIQSGQLPGFLSGNDQTILNFVEKNIFQNPTVQNLLAEARKKGLNAPDAAVLQLMFTGVYTMFSNFLASSPFAAMFPEARERGRQMHYRSVLKAYLRSQNQTNGLPELAAAEMLALSTPALERRALGTAVSDADVNGVRKRWNALWDSWSERKMKAAGGPATARAAVGAIPPFSAALTEESAREYREANGLTTNADKKAAADKAAADKKGEDAKVKEAKDKEAALKDRPAIQNAIDAYNNRAPAQRYATLEIQDTVGAGTPIIATSIGDHTSAELIEHSGRDAATCEEVGERRVRFNGLNAKSTQEVIKGLVITA